MEISFTPSYEEFFSAGSIATRIIFSKQIKRLRFANLGSILLAGFAFGYVYDTVSDKMGTWMAWLCGVGVGFSLYIVLAFVCQKAFRRGMPHWLRGVRPESPVRFSVGPEGLEWSSAHSTHKVGFRDIDCIVRDRKLVGFVSAATLFSVPLRAFSQSAPPDMLIRAVFDRLTDQAKARSRTDAHIRTIVGG